MSIVYPLNWNRGLNVCIHIHDPHIPAIGMKEASMASRSGSVVKSISSQVMLCTHVYAHIYNICPYAFEVQGFKIYIVDSVFGNHSNLTLKLLNPIRVRAEGPDKKSFIYPYSECVAYGRYKYPSHNTHIYSDPFFKRMRTYPSGKKDFVIMQVLLVFPLKTLCMVSR